RLGSRVKEIAVALVEDARGMAEALARGERVTIAGTELGPDDVVLSQEVMEGWGVASEAGVTVALDLDLTPELRQERLAREVVRVVQEARKEADLRVTDRITLRIRCSGELARSIAKHADYIRNETLATELS